MVKVAISNVGLTEFVEGVKYKYNTYLYKNYSATGIELSGGEAQKIAIARAMYKNSPLLILDEPTASLDPRTEDKLYTNFIKMSKEKTTFFISHRLAASTVADKIIVFDQGESIESGNHKKLMKEEDIYANMFTKQSSAYKY